MFEQLPIDCNVRITAMRDGEVVDQRVHHNVMTNTGRNWLARLIGLAGPGLPHTNDRIMYMGLGCGGEHASRTGLLKTQVVDPTVIALQEPIRLQSISGPYLKQVNYQYASQSSVYFPTATSCKFIVDLAENELAFDGSVTGGTGTTVGTSVPISEAGLYLSSASMTPASPVAANQMVAYNTFDPITITPGVTVRLEWEIRFG